MKVYILLPSSSRYFTQEREITQEELNKYRDLVENYLKREYPIAEIEVLLRGKADAHEKSVRVVNADDPTTEEAYRDHIRVLIDDVLYNGEFWLGHEKGTSMSSTAKIKVVADGNAISVADERIALEAKAEAMSWLRHSWQFSPSMVAAMKKIKEIQDKKAASAATPGEGEGENQKT